MPRKFSLRGTISGADNSIIWATNPIFDYVSTDRTKAWRVVSAYLWPATWDGGTTSDGQTMIAGVLHTDYVKFTSWNELSDVRDNRTFGWLQAGMKNVDNGGDDFLAPQSLNTMPQFTIDPDTIIVKELWLSVATKMENQSINGNRDWSYLIILEEMKLTPSESVFQQIKGMGQDVE
jgi:hypothetical protein